MQSVDLTIARGGAAPLWLLSDGSFAEAPHDPVAGMAAVPALVTAARWVSSRRTTTFECLFPKQAFHQGRPQRTERLSARRARGTLGQLVGVLAAARVGGEAATSDAKWAGQARSAALTVSSHLVATVRNDPAFRAVADDAADLMFSTLEHETWDALRAHTILLLQLRGLVLNASHQRRARELLRGLVRDAPPYAELPRDLWRFAMCSAPEFRGMVDVLEDRHRFRRIDGDRPGYDVLVAPFAGPSGQPLRVYARSASPEDENREMGDPSFVGLAIHRHAQLGSFDLRAAAVDVRQQGYKIVLNSQCAGLTTRFAISRLFPDADLYSSWDSTYFRTGARDAVTASEGVDCFVALLQGMAAGETHEDIAARMKAVQWRHVQAASDKDFVQFVGPSHPEVVRRFSDVNQDGRADRYDGFLDLYIEAIAEDIRASATPRDPGIPASAVGGEAAAGLNWAAGSMNRVTQYSDLWAALPGSSERFYRFEAAGFYSHLNPPTDMIGDAGQLPAVCRFVTDGPAGGAEYRVEVMFHAWLSHTGKELKRLLVAADAAWRAFDLGYLPTDGEFETLLSRRCLVLLTLAGLLDYPADQNDIDGLWAAALRMLAFPDLSRTQVRECITRGDHDSSNYYGSRRGMKQLVASLAAGDPVILGRMSSPDPAIGRARPLEL